MPTPPACVDPSIIGWSVNTAVMEPALFVASPSPADRAAMTALSPLATDLFLRVGPFDVPVGVLATPGAAELEDCATSDVLRAFLRANPWEVMVSFTSTGWLLLAADDDTLVFTQHHDPPSLAPVVTFTRRLDRFTPSTIGGARLGPVDRGQDAEYLYAAVAHGGGLELEWNCGQEVGGATRVLERVEVLETDHEVHVLLLSRRGPGRPTQDLKSGRWISAGTGRSAQTRVHLSRPLGPRHLLDNSSIPARRLDIHPPQNTDRVDEPWLR